MARENISLEWVALMLLVGFLLFIMANFCQNQQEKNVNKDNQDPQPDGTSDNSASSVRDNTTPEPNFPIENYSPGEIQDTVAKEETSTEEEFRKLGDRVFRVRRFQIQKQGLSKAECEDKSALSSSTASALRVAVADGVTESLFSGIWADLVVNSYVEKGDELLTASGLESPHQEFVQKSSQQILQMPDTQHWFMYEKLERGSHVTFAAVEFFSPEKIQALAVGDSCIFWRNGENEEVGMLPELSPEDFGAFPTSICHLPRTWQTLNQKIIRKEVHLKDAFQIVLCTDALACWLVKELGNDFSAWEQLFHIPDAIYFTDFIATLRERKEIRNDDVTLVLIDAIPLHDRLQ